MTIDGTFFSNLGTRPNAYEGTQNINVFGFASSIDPLSYAEQLKDYLDEKIEYTRVQHKITKRTGSIILQNLVLPNIFIRQNRLYIRTSLRVEEDDPSRFRIEVVVSKSMEENGCMGTFMLGMLPMLRHEEHSFISSPLETIEKSLQTANTINQHTLVPMSDLRDHFTEDHEAIVRFRTGGKQPFKVSIPKGIRWKDFKRFDKLLAVVGSHAFVTERSFSASQHRVGAQEPTQSS